MRDVVITKKGGKAGVRRRLSSMEAKALVALGHATYAQDVAPSQAAAEPVRAKRTYNRRDMTATMIAPANTSTTGPARSLPNVMVTKSSDGETA